MNTVATENQVDLVISATELLAHWQGHRGLTRKMIEAFPEKDLFEFSIGGMRPFAAMMQELLAIGVPGLRQIVSDETQELNEQITAADSKANIISLWDHATGEIDRLWAQIPDEKFHETILAFGQYEGTVISSILYFIDNEIHHRAQGYVYLRSLGIEPPAFWDRQM